MSEGDRTLEGLVAAIDAAMDGSFESRLRAELAAQEPAWLVDELVRLVVRERHLEASQQRQLSRHAQHIEPLAERRRRLRRIEDLGLDGAKLEAIVERYRQLDRAALESGGFLVDPPHRGKEALDRHHRSADGESLLEEAHDLFYALLFCDSAQGVRLPRVQRDFLTVTLPSSKAALLERFMLAVTETRAAGTWLDPEGVSDDIEARNTVLQVEFGDTGGAQVSDGLVAVLRLVNNLEINEEILYARIERLEKSTLVD